MAFSSHMGPDELARWLLDTYGQEYQDDIDKLKTNKINGELFLELPEDEEFLKELKLSLGFKKLVVKKAKELKQGNGPAQTSNGQGSGNHATTTATISLIGVGFSSTMTPDQLAQWLLQEYGEAYKREINKLTDALINGELFLDLPDDKELLEDLKLSPAFKRLVVKKAKQLKESSSASASVPTATSNSDANLPETESRMHIPLCSSADLDETDTVSGNVESDAMEMEAEGDTLSAWVPRNVIWNKKGLAVKFLNDVPSHWTYAGSGMNVGNIMSWANEWSLRGGGTIPEFTLVENASARSDIRVVFTSNGRTETMIGKKATRAKYTEPTMWLDLHSNTGLDDKYKKHLVVHEFGHALGLGHEHQRSDFWKLIKPYIDMTKMRKKLNISDASFAINWDNDKLFERGKCTAYDPHSVMHYWFETDWLTKGYANKSKVEKDRNSGTLPQDVAEALLGVHGRSGVPLADRPSDTDIQLLKDLYGNTSCTILGPPPQPGNLQEHERSHVNRVMSDDGASQQQGARKMDFSTRMGPDELAQWLLATYGQAYQSDIDKFKSALINGELFLELPGDDELLKELQLSIGFKRLVVKKAKELKQGNGPTQTSNGQGSGNHATTTTAAVLLAANDSASVAQAQAIPVSAEPKNTDRLTMDHFQQVLNVAWPARTKYSSLGIELGLAADDIESIEKSKQFLVDESFTDMIKACLRQGLLTQKKLADALSTNPVGLGYLSEEVLAVKFTTPPKVARSPVPPVTAGMPRATDAEFDRFEVKHHFISRLEWKDLTMDEPKCVRVYSKAAWKWNLVADNLGLEPGEIESIRRNHYTDDERVTDVFRHWFDNANNLPNKGKYPKKWSGLIRLLKDSDLGELSEEVHKAVSAPYSSARAEFDRFEVKHYFVSRLEWKDSPMDESKCVRVYNKAAWKWNRVADNLGLEPGEIESIRRNHFTDDERVTDVFRHWFDNANNLPNKERYPKKWSGLIRLLKDSDLGQLSEEVKRAVSAPYSSARGNL